MAEIPTLYAHRPIILRHQKAAMYHPFIEAAAMTLVDIPITLATLAAYTLVLYFVVGLQGSVGQYSQVLSSRFSPSLLAHALGQYLLPFRRCYHIGYEDMLPCHRRMVQRPNSCPISCWYHPLGFDLVYRLQYTRTLHDPCLTLDNLHQRM